LLLGSTTADGALNLWHTTLDRCPAGIRRLPSHPSPPRRTLPVSVHFNDTTVERIFLQKQGSCSEQATRHL